MKINYNVTGAERKSLVGAISQELNAPTKYLGMPTAAYEVGVYNIDKTGTLTGPDNKELVAALCGLHSFKAVSEEYDMQVAWASSSRSERPAPLPEAEKTPAFEDLAMTAEEELGMGRQCRDPQGEDGMQASDVPEADELDTLTIEMPLDGLTDTAIANLEKLVESKAALIRKAIGADNLPVERTETTLRFPWFTFGVSADEVNAYTQFIAALCAMAKEQKRVTAKDKPVDNEKYAFRCFLLRLGFIGNGFKDARRILLANLDGNGSFKSGERRPENEAASDTEAAPDTLAETLYVGESEMAVTD